MQKQLEGTRYKTIELYGNTFEIKYGYYEDYERESEFGEPLPIYPDFIKQPLYTSDGYPFVTKMLSMCEHGKSEFRDACCAECPYYLHGADMIGICRCEENRLRKNE